LKVFSIKYHNKSKRKSNKLKNKENERMNANNINQFETIVDVKPSNKVKKNKTKKFIFSPVKDNECQKEQASISTDTILNQEPSTENPVEIPIENPIEIQEETKVESIVDDNITDDGVKICPSKLSKDELLALLKIQEDKEKQEKQDEINKEDLLHYKEYKLKTLQYDIDKLSNQLAELTNEFNYIKDGKMDKQLMEDIIRRKNKQEEIKQENKKRTNKQIQVHQKKGVDYKIVPRDARLKEDGSKLDKYSYKGYDAKYFPKGLILVLNSSGTRVEVIHTGIGTYLLKDNNEVIFDSLMEASKYHQELSGAKTARVPYYNFKTISGQSIKRVDLYPLILNECDIAK
jgi:hypothetical protein